MKKTTVDMQKDVMGSDVPTSLKLTWWILTPDGDIYSERLEPWDEGISAVCQLDSEETKVCPRTMCPSVKRVGAAYGFELGRGPGELDTLFFARLLAAVEKLEATVVTPPQTRPNSNVGESALKRAAWPTLGKGTIWKCVGPQGCKLLGKAALDGTGPSRVSPITL